jgi:hypothetical protein
MADYYRFMQRTAPQKKERVPIVAYDFETTRIPTKDGDEMTVHPLYIAFHGKTIRYATPLFESYDQTADAFRHIWPQLENGTMLCAYNANRFDLRIAMQSFIETEFTVEPFASRVAGLRGAILRKGRKRVLMLDPIAMLGMQCDLRTFIAVFAPNYPKGEIDFGSVTFDPDNPDHVAYAKRDAEALYHAMQKASTVVRAITGRNLAATIGALAIRTFMSRMPRSAVVPALRPEQYRIVRRIIMRGGYVASRRFRGKLWTYDLNQAYAFAMRSCSMPSGRCLPTNTYRSGIPSFFRCVLTRCDRSPVPYIVRTCEKPYLMIETYGERCETWLTNDEIDCLRRHHWTVETISGYAFEGSFSMRQFVNGLEARRRHFPKDHPVNIICKYIGCNAYGKTLQEPITTRIVLSRVPLQGAFPLCEDDAGGRPIPGFWIVPETKDTRRCFERPQIGAWITAFVRCTVFDAIMQAPDAFVKADTDSVSFSRPIALPISSWRYGEWKIESAGDFHIVVAKKVYWSASKHAAKGLRIRELTREDYERWHLGQVPSQEQIQLVNWKKGPAPKWRSQTRRGTAVP